MLTVLSFVNNNDWPPPDCGYKGMEPGGALEQCLYRLGGQELVDAAQNGELHAFRGSHDEPLNKYAIKHGEGGLGINNSTATNGFVNREGLRIGYNGEMFSFNPAEANISRANYLQGSMDVSPYGPMYCVMCGYPLWCVDCKITSVQPPSKGIEKKKSKQKVPKDTQLKQKDIDDCKVVNGHIIDAETAFFCLAFDAGFKYNVQLIHKKCNDNENTLSKTKSLTWIRNNLGGRRVRGSVAFSGPKGCQSYKRAPPNVCQQAFDEILSRLHVADYEDTDYIERLCESAVVLGQGGIPETAIQLGDANHPRALRGIMNRAKVATYLEGHIVLLDMRISNMKKEAVKLLAEARVAETEGKANALQNKAKEIYRAAEREEQLTTELSHDKARIRAYQEAHQRQYDMLEHQRNLYWHDYQQAKTFFEQHQYWMDQWKRAGHQAAAAANQAAFQGNKYYEDYYRNYARHGYYQAAREAENVRHAGEVMHLKNQLFLQALQAVAVAYVGINQFGKKINSVKFAKKYSMMFTKKKLK